MISLTARPSIGTVNTASVRADQTPVGESVRDLTAVVSAMENGVAKSVAVGDTPELITLVASNRGVTIMLPSVTLLLSA